MERDSRLGDRMPDRRAVKWGDMRPSNPQMSEEWVEMEASETRMSDRWVEQHPSNAQMSEKYVEMEAGNSEFSDRWHDMKQEKRDDPYSMAPSKGDRGEHFKPMAKEQPANRVGRSTQHNEFGSTREI